MAAAAEVRERLAALSAQRDALEVEAAAITMELTTPGPNGEPPAGVKDSLVDSEGFPRADLDLYRVRGMRNRLACIQTDHKELMGTIENKLHELHALLRMQQAGEGTEEGDGLTGSLDAHGNGNDNANANDGADGGTAEVKEGETAQALVAFALIDEVFDGSPAADAGVCVGDRLLQFGPVNYSNHDGLQAIPQVVRNAMEAEGAISLTVQRSSGEEDENGSGAVIVLSLTPRVWSGRGVIGCHLRPI